MKKTRTRLWSLLLTVAMLLTLLPTTALAGGEECTEESCTHVAAIGTTHYDSLADAVAAVHQKTGDERMEGTTITLLRDATGGGIGAGYESIANGTTSGKNPVNFTIDLNKHTYSVDSPAVGSAGTETNGFQLLQGSIVVIKNGSIDSALQDNILIQNYSNLTLEDVNLTATGADYVLSDNCGDVNIQGSTSITAGSGKVAFDVCGYTNYPGVTVTVDTTGTITGEIEVTRSSGNNNPVNLSIKNGIFKSSFDVQDQNATISITGGTFSSEPDKSYIATGYDVREVSGGYQVGKPVTVIFVSEGTAVKTEKIFAGDTVTAPSVSKEGYVLESWVDEAGAVVDLSKPVVSDLTLTAQWAIKTYTVTYAVDGVEQEKTMSHGAKITYVPEKEGYAFAGWYLDETMTESWDMETDVVTSDITLYAKWNEVVTPDDQPAGVDQIQVAPSIPVIDDNNAPAGSAEVVEALQGGVEQEGVTEAAKDLAFDSAYMAEIAAEAKTKLELGDDENVTLVVETSLNISVTDVKDGDSFTLDITPTYTITATADGKTTTIVEDEPLTVTEPVTLTIPLPESFADAAKLFVHHLKNGRTYVYDGKVLDGKLTFLNPHGFSLFTVSRAGAEASVDGVQYATLQEAVDAVENGGTVTVHQSGLYAQVSGVKTFWVETDTGVEMPLLYAAPGYTLSKDGNKYTVRVRTIDDPDNDYTLPTWDIIVEDSDNGDVEVSPEEAKPTTTITITVTPDKGYAVAEVVVTAENGKKITVTDKGNGKYTFSMPNSDVTIEVTFQPVSGGAAGSDLTITAPTGWVNPFTDVAANAWYYDAVGYANANGLMGGTSATTFAPNGAMNRSMVWTVIARLAGQTISGANWAEDAKAWAVAQGVSDGTNPDGNVTREELVTMLYRYIGSPVMNVPELGLINSYPDAASVSDWAQDAFAWALSRGIIDGRDGKLASGESVTRAEAATILARFHLLTK